MYGNRTFIDLAPYIYIYIYTQLCIYTPVETVFSTCMYLYIRIHIHNYVYRYTCIDNVLYPGLLYMNTDIHIFTLYTYIHIYLYIIMYIHIYVRAYIGHVPCPSSLIYVYIFIYVNIHIQIIINVI
jgi:hypothetical protein